jgi:non-ribosomal peptide synthetase component F
MDAVLEREDLTQRLEAASLNGMTMAVWAEAQPDKAAVIDPDGTRRSFAEVNANANRLVRVLRQAGLFISIVMAGLVPATPEHRGGRFARSAGANGSPAQGRG